MSALAKIIAKRNREQNRIVENDIAKGKKSNDWIWWYFPIPKSVLVKGLSNEDRTAPYALTDEDTMAFINDPVLCKKYRDMVEKVDYDSFFDKIDDKRKFKESIFHFLHFSIDFLTFHNTRAQYKLGLTDDELLTIRNSGGYDEKIHDITLYKKVIKLFDNTRYDARVFVGNEVDVSELLKICFNKKNKIERDENQNLEYINEQWFELQKKF